LRRSLTSGNNCARFEAVLIRTGEKVGLADVRSAHSLPMGRVRFPRATIPVGTRSWKIDPNLKEPGRRFGLSRAPWSAQRSPAKFKDAPRNQRDASAQQAKVTIEIEKARENRRKGGPKRHPANLNDAVTFCGFAHKWASDPPTIAIRIREKGKKHIWEGSDPIWWAKARLVPRPCKCRD